MTLGPDMLWLTSARGWATIPKTAFPMKRYNLHNHTSFSDGAFSPEEIVQAAIRGGLEGIGISDHFFTSKVYHGLSYEAWHDIDFAAYLTMATRLKQESAAPIKVWVGIELDSCLKRVGKPLEALPWPAINTLDYLLIEYVGEGDLGGLSLGDVEKVRNLCRIPVILAHPNIERLTETVPLNLVVEVLRRHRVAIEIPAGTRNEFFWNRIDPTPLRRVALTIGTDTHHQLTEVADIARTLAFLAKTGLEKNLATPDTLVIASGGAL